LRGLAFAGQKEAIVGREQEESGTRKTPSKERLGEFGAGKNPQKMQEVDKTKPTSSESTGGMLQELTEPLGAGPRTPAEKREGLSNRIISGGKETRQKMAVISQEKKGLESQPHKSAL